MPGREVRRNPLKSAAWQPFSYQGWKEREANRCKATPRWPPLCVCEMPAGHEGAHMGRTRYGYWKSWDAG